MVGCGFYKRTKDTDSDWLRVLLSSNFVGLCRLHQDLAKNDINVFCIDCNVEICRHCLNDKHCGHQRLKIRKYVYQDVVRLQDMQTHYDCSRIQTYKINGEKAVHLNPRRQSKDAKPSTKAKFGASCVACGRYIQDLPNRFCSIACKVSPVLLKSPGKNNNMIAYTNDQEFSDLSLKDSYNQEKNSSENESTLSLTDMSEETQGLINSSLKPRKRLHKRKGIPLRAPLV